MGVDGSTPGDIHNDVSVDEPSSLVLIGTFGTSPSCGLNVSQEVGNKQQSTPPGLVRKSQKMDTDVNIKLRNDLDSTSIFSKLIGHKLSDSSSGNLYTRCMMNFTADLVQSRHKNSWMWGS